MMFKKLLFIVCCVLCLYASTAVGFSVGYHTDKRVSMPSPPPLPAPILYELINNANERTPFLARQLIRDEELNQIRRRSRCLTLFKSMFGCYGCLAFATPFILLVITFMWIWVASPQCSFIQPDKQVPVCLAPVWMAIMGCCASCFVCPSFGMCCLAIASYKGQKPESVVRTIDVVRQQRITHHRSNAFHRLSQESTDRLAQEDATSDIEMGWKEPESLQRLALAVVVRHDLAQPNEVPLLPKLKQEFVAAYTQRQRLLRGLA